jgi:hypothetical protein
VTSLGAEGTSVRAAVKKGVAWWLLMSVLLALSGGLGYGGTKLSNDERAEITRGLMAEYAKSKVTLPRSKKPLSFPSDGKYDRDAWEKAMMENGPAARVGDEIQITNVVIEEKKVLLEINHGLKSGQHWYDHVQVGMGGTMGPVNRGQNGQGAAGTNIALVFPKGVPSLTANDLKAMLNPIFDFSKRSATQDYVASLPEPIKKAIHEQRPIEGMNREQVLLALGRPRNKSRETRDGDEVEDWIYGEPPGKVTLITFSEGKVIKIRQDYANVGGYTAPPLPPN